MIDTDRYRELLEEERTRLVDLRASISEATEDAERKPAGDPATGGHVADAGSEMFERSRDLSILIDVDAQLADIEHAETRLSNGSYGACEACGRPIGAERLRARPAARFCITDQAGAEREVHVR
ncbi:MAG: TraR/DksA family transcriptional regulator [Actinomycetota bacterium]